MRSCQRRIDLGRESDKNCIRHKGNNYSISLILSGAVTVVLSRVSDWRNESIRWFEQNQRYM